MVQPLPPVQETEDGLRTTQSAGRGNVMGTKQRRSARPSGGLLPTLRGVKHCHLVPIPSDSDASQTHGPDEAQRHQEIRQSETQRTAPESDTFIKNGRLFSVAT